MAAKENPTCIARLVQFKVVAVATQPRLHHIQHLNKLPLDKVAQLDISAKCCSVWKESDTGEELTEIAHQT